jgi:hypothetical protein
MKASVPTHKMIEFLAARLMAASPFPMQLNDTRQVRNGSEADMSFWPPSRLPGAVTAARRSGGVI